MAKRYTQPQGNAQIDPRYAGETWSAPTNALAVGGGSPAVATNRLGRGLLGNGSSWYSRPASSIDSTINGLTFVFVAGGVAGGSTNAMICGDSTSTANFIWLSNGAGVLRFRIDTASYDFAGVDTTVMASYVLCVFWDGSRHVQLFRNGVYLGSQSGGSGVFTYDTVGGGYSGNPFALNGSLNLLHVIPRSFPAEENLSISANPWQIFKGNTLILPAASVTLPTIGRPATDGPTGAWTATGGTGTLASAIGELTAIDTDYISVTSASTYTGTLNACAYPGGATQTVSFRGSSTTGSSVTLTFVQSGVTLLTWTQALTSTVTTYTHNLTTLTGDATAITFTIASS